MQVVQHGLPCRVAGGACAHGDVGEQQAQRRDAHLQLARGNAGKPSGIAAAKPAELILVAGEARITDEEKDGFIGEIFHRIFITNGGSDAK